MRYILDISKAKKPLFWEEGDPVLLPLEDWKNYTSYDLVEDDLPVEFVKKMRRHIMGIKTPDGKPYHYASANRLPVGVDVDEIERHGGRLRKVKN